MKIAAASLEESRQSRGRRPPPHRTTSLVAKRNLAQCWPRSMQPRSALEQRLAEREVAYQDAEQRHATEAGDGCGAYRRTSRKARRCGGAGRRRPGGIRGAAEDRRPLRSKSPRRNRVTEAAAAAELLMAREAELGAMLAEASEIRQVLEGHLADRGARHSARGRACGPLNERLASERQMTLETDLQQIEDRLTRERGEHEPAG